MKSKALIIALSIIVALAILALLFLWYLYVVPWLHALNIGDPWKVIFIRIAQVLPILIIVGWYIIRYKWMED
jgi:hypothetical protein